MENSGQVRIPDGVPLREGVQAILENSQFTVTPITAEQNRALPVPVDFLAASGGHRFVVKCLAKPEELDADSLQRLVEFCRGNGINEVMLIGDGEFSDAVVACAAALAVRLTGQSSYRQTLANLPPEVLRELAGPVRIPETYVAKSSFDPPVDTGFGSYAAKSSFEEPVESDDSYYCGGSTGGMVVEQPLVDPNYTAPPRKRSLRGEIGVAVAVLVVVIGIKTAAKYGVNDLISAISVHVEEAQRKPAPPKVNVSKLVGEIIIETRNASGFSTPVFGETSLIEIPDSKITPPAEKLEEMFRVLNPSLEVENSELFVAADSSALVAKLKTWEPLSSQADVEFGSLSSASENGELWAWLYQGKKIDREEQLTKALRNGGSFLLKCKHCGGDSLYNLTAHAKYFVAPVCVKCGLTAHVFGPDTEGNYRKGPDFLTGFKIPEEKVIEYLPINPEFRTEKDHVLAHWRAILDQCDYEFDSVDYGVAARDIWKLPEQTWNERFGDCEDTSILLADALISSGFDARVAIGSLQGSGHVWCVVKAEGRQWILETTMSHTGSVSLRSIIKVGGDYIAEFMFDRENIYLRRNASNLSTPDYFSERYWLTMNVNEPKKGSLSEKVPEPRVLVPVAATATAAE